MALPLSPVARACAEAVGAALEMPADAFAVSAPPRPELGDFAVGCFPAAKVKRAAPPKLAADVAAAFEPTDLLASAEASGPFVNFRVNREALFRLLAEATLGDGELVPKDIGAGKTVCVDFSSPNISKHLAYHHIRSTVIGHALTNLYRAVGYRVVGINHLGDWGTTHGYLLAAYEMWGAPEPLTVDALNALYVRFRAAMKEDETLADRGRAWFKRLEDGDAEARRLWKWFRDVSWAEFEAVYETLGVEFDEVKGESDFVDAMPAVLEMLADKGLSGPSDGALVVALDDVGIKVPLMLIKSDGGTTYATRDLAAAMHRWDSYHFERSLYVVDRGQSLHFNQLFATLLKAGFEWSERCAHVPFGLVRIGGKKTGTRAGNVVLLKEVLAEATSRAADKIRETDLARGRPEMSEDDLASTARVVGVGAVVFANLVSSRNNDVDFDWEDVLAVNGDTGVYLQYGHARCQNIARKGADMGSATGSVDADLSLLSTELEWALARRLSDFADHVARAADGNDPHIVARYLLDLVSAFSRWYTEGNGDRALRVLCEDDATRAARLTLTAIVATTIREGLALLGLDAPDSM